MLDPAVKGLTAKINMSYFHKSYLEAMGTRPRTSALPGYQGQAWAQLTSVGTVWFGQRWVGNGTGYFDSKGSSSALAVVEDSRGDGYAHAHGEMVPVKSGPSTGSKKTGLLGAQAATLRIGRGIYSPIQ